jgi:hypothetical protein
MRKVTIPKKLKDKVVDKAVEIFKNKLEQKYKSRHN